MIRKDEIMLGSQYMAPGQIWWFDLGPYEYKSEINPHSKRPYLVIASIGRRIYVTPVTHSNINGSNFRFSIPMIRNDKIDGTPDVSYVCMDNIRQIRVDSYVADGGTYEYAGCLTPGVMQKLMAGFIASVLFNNYGIDFISEASQMAADMLEERDDYAVTGFTPCVVHGDAELVITDDDTAEYKKDYRMINTINAQNNRTCAKATKKNAIGFVPPVAAADDDADEEEEKPSITPSTTAPEPINSKEVSELTEARGTTEHAQRKSYIRYDTVSVDRGTLKFESEEKAEEFARSLIEPSAHGKITLVEFQQEFTRITGSFINRDPAARILKDVSMNITDLGNSYAYGCAYKRDILKSLTRKECPIDKFNKKQALLNEVRQDVEAYGATVAGYKWGYSPKYITSLLG